MCHEFLNIIDNVILNKNNIEEIYCYLDFLNLKIKYLKIFINRNFNKLYNKILNDFKFLIFILKNIMDHDIKNLINMKILQS